MSKMPITKKLILTNLSSREQSWLINRKVSNSLAMRKKDAECASIALMRRRTLWSIPAIARANWAWFISTASRDGCGRTKARFARARVSALSFGRISSAKSAPKHCPPLSKTKKVNFSNSLISPNFRSAKRRASYSSNPCLSLLTRPKIESWSSSSPTTSKPSSQLAVTKRMISLFLIAPSAASKPSWPSNRMASTSTTSTASSALPS